MPRPPRPPIGLLLDRTAKSVSRAFDDALVAAGGSRSTWLVLLAIKTTPEANQRTLAEAVGIQGATLTHHLNAMEADGLLTRRRDPANRRMHLVEPTERGEALFATLRDAAIAFDRRLRTGLSDEDVALVGRVFAQMRENVATAEELGDP